MRKSTILTLACLCVAGSAAPVVAADTMMSSHNSMMSSHDSMMAGHGTMMKAGQGMVVMPNGDTMTTTVPSSMMKGAMAVNDCVILMMGHDHKMHMIDSKAACAEMSKMGH